MSPEAQLQALAYRQAGRAVILRLLGLQVSASILDRTAMPRIPELRQDRRMAETFAQAELGGFLAEQRYSPRTAGWPVEQSRLARQLLRPFTSNELQLQALVSRLRMAARKQIQDPITWRSVQAVARELLTQTRLSAENIQEICIEVERGTR
jgi:hypothetical protein